MTLASVFRLSLYALTAFASWILGSAEEGWVPFLTLPVLVAAFVATESKGNWSLPAWMANAFGALAVLTAAFEFSHEGQLAKLLSGAHLLVYATWIVMFQEKSIRNYWWLMGLSILQIAVASVLANESSPSFGLFLMAYVCGALWTMSVASLYQAQLQFAGGTEMSRPAAVVPQPSERRVLQYDGRERWITSRLIVGVGGLIGFSLAVSAIFFAFTPRIWIGPQNIFGSERVDSPYPERRRTGFAESVRLGEIGQILESMKTVMEVRTYDAHSQQPTDLSKVAERLGMGEPLFRGTVLTEYFDGRWAPERAERPVPRAKTFHQQGYRVDIVLEPVTTSDVLFTLGLPDACRVDREDEGALLNLSSGMLVRQSRPESAEQLSYTLYVRPIDPELAALHATVMPSGVYWENADGNYLRRTSRLPRASLERLSALARKIVAQAETAARRPLTDHEKVQALVRHLRDSGEYGYTLNLSIQDYTVDPVEDFLFNRKEGHCEYFATALALMARSVGVPARVISGFQGAERNGIKGCWEVQERHAHLWVEVWIDGSTWVTVDPTPGLPRAKSVAEIGARVGFWGRMRATTNSLWTDYVVNVNLGQQKRQLYEPLSDFAQKLWLTVRGAIEWGPIAWNYLLRLLQNPEELFSVVGAVILIGIALILFGTAKLILWILRRVFGVRWTLNWTRRRQQRLVVAFYDRFLKVVGRYGLRRTPSDTPREFSVTVVQKLRESLSGDRLDDLPAAVCTAYYRVRFGGEVLTEGELQSLEQDLSRFEGCLRSPGNG
jgi:transglutaminase-like putative cysteine protease